MCRPHFPVGGTRTRLRLGCSAVLAAWRPWSRGVVHRCRAASPGAPAGPENRDKRGRSFARRPMAFAFDPTYPFLAVLLVYMVYSQWAHLDSRYLVGGALLLLVVTAVVDAAGLTGEANVLAVYVFYLLAGGVMLLLVDHVREERAAARRRRSRRGTPGGRPVAAPRPSGDRREGPGNAVSGPDASEVAGPVGEGTGPEGPPREEDPGSGGEVPSSPVDRGGSDLGKDGTEEAGQTNSSRTFARPLSPVL